MNVLLGKQLRKKSGVLVDPEEALRNKVVAFYFSAGWCPPCQRFTPLLAEFYEKTNGATDAKKTFEVVFVSSDKTPSDMNAYMQQAHGDWLAVPFGHDIIKDLKKKYHITGIPKLVVVTDDGDVVTHQGRKEVTQVGPLCFKHWTQAVTSARGERGETKTIATTATRGSVAMATDE